MTAFYRFNPVFPTGLVLAETALLILFCLPTTARADQIETMCGGSTIGADNGIAGNVGSVGMLYSTSCTLSANGGTLIGQAQGQLSTGVFGATATISGPVASSGYSAVPNSGVLMNYFFVTPGLTSGTAVFDVTLDPALDATGRGLALVYVVPGVGITAPELLNGNSAFDITSSGSVTIPFSVPITNGMSGAGANIRLDFYMWSEVGCYAGSGSGGCSATADFLDPAMITGVTIYDTSGNIVPGETLTSTSQGGLSISASPSAVTPEPSGLALLGSGLLGMMAVAWRKNFAR